ncbi:MAG: transcriptional regulator, partial [Cytophagales bacterium]|nr:transcriptional regulator [Cytophagales bacterium]
GNALCAAFDGNGVFLLESDVWQKLDLPGVTRVNALSPSANGVLACVPGGVWNIRPGEAPQPIKGPLMVDPREATFDPEGKLWIADGINGLVSNWEGAFRSYSPAGPLSNAVRRVVSGAGQMAALPGDFGPNYAPLSDTAGVSFFTGEGWRNYAARIPGAGPLPEARDLLRAAYNPADGSWYLGSYGGGLLVLGADGSVTRFDQDNSPLRASTEGGVRVTGLAVDGEGNAWVALFGVPFGAPSLFVRRKDGTWGSFAFSNIAARFPLDLVLDDAGNKWMPLASVQGGGLWVFDDQGNRSRYLSATFGSGGLPNANVRSLAKDREGQMWVGTERGAAVFFAPADVLRGAAVDATIPVYAGSRLLRDEVVTAIAVDGGNRKWFGTRNGVFLFNPTTDKLVSHFTAANSPLPANSVSSLAIEGRTGEVFVATSEGLASYRAAATEANPESDAVQIFPNPVRPGFEGLVGISGLPENAVVKITDASGRLVHETRAQGGTAAWNVRDYRGRRAATGIYLVYAADAEGRKMLVGKMAVIE